MNESSQAGEVNNQNVPDAPASDTPRVGDDLLLTTKQHAPADAGAAINISGPGGGYNGLIPGYVLERELDRGGMGIVYLARQVSLNRSVAIKVARSGQLGAKELQRFLTEAETVAAVKHKNVVQVHDYGEVGGRPYMVLEFCSGGCLAQRLAGGKFDPQTAVELLLKISEGVAAAHARGIVHRDLKPSNILFDAEGEPKVADFGIAKLASSDLTATQAFLGTPAYMSPEQASGAAKSVRPSADVWALGVIAYECLTGARPFDADTPEETRGRLLAARPAALCSRLPIVSHELESIYLKCLTQRPSDRFASAAELAEALRQFLTPTAPLPASRLPARRLPDWARYSAVPLGAACIGLAIGLSQPLANRSKQLPTDEVKAPESVPLEPGPEPRVVLIGDGGSVCALAFLDGGRLATGLESGVVKIWDWQKATVRNALEQNGGNGGNIWSASLSPDGKYLMTASDDSAITFWNLRTLSAELSFPESVSTKTAVFSPDGRHLATGSRNSRVRIWDWTSQVPLAELHHRGTVHSLSYNPDGSRLASAGSDGKVCVWDVKDVGVARDAPVKSLMELSEHRGAVYSVAYNPDGSKLASSGWDGYVRIWDTATGTQLQSIKGHGGDARSVSFGNTGKWLASCGSDGYVKVWEIETGKEVFAYRGARAFHVVRFAPDGTTLAAGGHDGTVRMWDVRSVK